MIPFSGHYTADLPAPNNKHRLKIFRRFIGRLDSETTLDIGASNFIGRELGIKDFTHGDLNRTMRSPQEQYSIITCFEVINHLWNHGVLLDNIKARLKDGGTLYLSTPVRPAFGISWVHGRGNYCEVTHRSMRMLLEYYGFEVVRYEVHNPWPWFFIFYGFRPPFRYLFNRFQLYELRKR